MFEVMGKRHESMSTAMKTDKSEVREVAGEGAGGLLNKKMLGFIFYA